MRILALGDIVGRAGRLAISRHVPRLRKELELDFVMANGENMAGGVGMTNATLDEVFASGVDVITSGNHVWKHREILQRLEWDQRLLRPLNYPDFHEKTPGRGWVVHTLPDGRSLVIFNLQGMTFMDPIPSPFEAAWALMEHLDAASLPRVRIGDFHAEASSEKKTLAWYLDGRLSALVGSHTHVQTADAQILPQGTAYLTDLGMCGVEVSSLGMDADSVLERFLTQRPSAFKPAKGTPALNGACIDIDDEQGLAREIQLVRIDNPPATRQLSTGS